MTIDIDFLEKRCCAEWPKHLSRPTLRCFDGYLLGYNNARQKYDEAPIREDIDGAKFNK